MPTFTAIAFDRLIEPGASKPAYKSAPVPMPVPKKLERRSSEPKTVRKKPPPRPQLKPALYATPEVTPLLDAPSSFPPSPYIINHKRRGPRLLKSFSEANVQSKQENLDNEIPNGMSNDAVAASSDGDLQVNSTNTEPVKEEQVNGIHDTNLSSSGNNGGDLGEGHRESESSGILNGSSHLDKVVAFNLEREGESEDFFDPHDSMSLKSCTDAEDNTGADQAGKFSAAGGEFFDAWEELSSDGGTQNSHRDIEAELREIRLSLLMEIEKRKQVEESLNSMQSQWERLRQRLSLMGIALPSDLTAEGGQLSSDPMEDVCQQLYIARFISNTIGRGIARAEAEIEMEAQLESKNFEIARLLERLHCYETMNREMSQRNQEAVDLAFLSPSATKLEQRSGGGRSRRRQWLTKRCGGVLCCSRLRSSSRMRNLAAPHSLGVFIFRPNKPPFLTLPSLSRRSLPSIQCGAVQFRPCIDIHKGKVKQIVGSTLQDLKGSDPVTNFESDKSAAEYATLYKQDGLTGGHVIMLGADPLSKAAALQALHAYPGGLQVGGGINSDNCLSYIEEGASHVIVTSYVFNNGQMDIGRLKDLVQIVGKERLVLDLSCRKKDGKYAIVTDRWQKFSDVFVDPDVMEFLANFADEFLVHGVDVEGKKLGIDEELVALLGKYSTIPVTYAGGVTEMADLERIRTAGMERVNVTVGSALDIFGGNLAYEDVVAWHAQQNASVV